MQEHINPDKLSCMYIQPHLMTSLVKVIHVNKDPKCNIHICFKKNAFNLHILASDHINNSENCLEQNRQGFFFHYR